MTFDDRNDPNRPRDAPRTYEPREERSSGMVWGTLGVLAVLIAGGFFFYNSGSRAPDRTASNNTTQVVPSTPTPGPATGPAAPVPAPPKQ
jgi:hypothetical protein